MPKCILMKSKNVKDKEIIQNASKNKKRKKKLNTGERIKFISSYLAATWKELKYFFQSKIT